MKILLTLFFFLSYAILFAKTWDSFMPIEEGKAYLFDVDSLKVIGSADSDITHEKNVIVPYCEKGCGDADDDDVCWWFCNIWWNGSDSQPTEDVVWFMAYSFECQSEPMRNFKPMQQMIQDGDASRLSFFQRSSHTDLTYEYAVCISEYLNESVFDSITAYAFIYQKKDYYYALCYLYEKFTENDYPLYALYCIYQDDGTFNFGGPPQMKNTDWMRKSETSSIMPNVFKRNQKSPKQCPALYRSNIRINGTPAITRSSNIIINNKQPKLQLKRRKIK